MPTFDLPTITITKKRYNFFLLWNVITTIIIWIILIGTLLVIINKSFYEIFYTTFIKNNKNCQNFFFYSIIFFKNDSLTNVFRTFINISLLILFLFLTITSLVLLISVIERTCIHVIWDSCYIYMEYGPRDRIHGWLKKPTLLWYLLSRPHTWISQYSQITT